LKLQDEMGDAKSAASAHTRSGPSYLVLKQIAQADSKIRTSLEIARRISDREEEAQALGVLAPLDLKCLAFREAEQNIEEAIRLVESARLELQARDTRAGYFSTRRDYYDLGPFG